MSKQTDGEMVAAGLSRCPTSVNFLSSKPTPRVNVGGEEFTKPTAEFVEIGYGWPVVEEWTYRVRDRRLIGFSSGDARGGFGGVQLTALGRFLTEWGVRDAGK